MAHFFNLVKYNKARVGMVHYNNNSEVNQGHNIFVFHSVYYGEVLKKSHQRGTFGLEHGRLLSYHTHGANC